MAKTIIKFISFHFLLRLGNMELNRAIEFLCYKTALFIDNYCIPCSFPLSNIIVVETRTNVLQHFLCGSTSESNNCQWDVIAIREVPLLCALSR